jgi:uncharacterized membrane protein YdjX (TVP38/TMEM64 family)
MSTRVIVASALLLAAILVPFALWEDPLAEFSQARLDSSDSQLAAGVTIVVLLAADTVLPIPSSIVSASAGVMLGFYGGVAAIWAGMTLGSIAGYVIGRLAKGFLRKEELDPIKQKLERYGWWVIALSRPLPVLAEAVSITAGVIQLPFPRFLILSALSNLAVAITYGAAANFAWSNDYVLVYALAALTIPYGLMLLYRRLTS